MIKIFITNLGKYNEGELIGEWMSLPVDKEEFNEILDKIGINEEYEEYFITDYECDFMKISKYDNVEELNHIAEELEGLNDTQQTTLKAMIEIGFCNDVEDAIDEIGNFNLYEDITDEEELGRYMIAETGIVEIPDYLENYIDYEAFGRDYNINSDGGFTSYGFIEKN